MQVAKLNLLQHQFAITNSLYFTIHVHVYTIKSAYINVYLCALGTMCTYYSSLVLLYHVFLFGLFCYVLGGRWKKLAF